MGKNISIQQALLFSLIEKPGIKSKKNANQARLKHRLDSMYFLNKRCFSLLIFEVDLYQRSNTINIYWLFLELNLNTKERTSNERTHLFIFIKFIKKNQGKKTVKLHIRKNE